MDNTERKTITRVCLDCGKRFTTPAGNKVYCGNSNAKSSCAYKRRLKTVRERRKRERLIKRGKLKINKTAIKLVEEVEKPKKICIEQSLTPRQRQQMFIKKHNALVRRASIKLVTIHN